MLNIRLYNGTTMVLMIHDMPGECVPTHAYTHMHTLYKPDRDIEDIYTVYSVIAQAPDPRIYSDTIRTDQAP